MFGGTHELAESKLLLLYILDKIGYPISNTSLTEIVLENNFLNYFQLQQYLGELVNSGFIDISKQGKRQMYSLHTKGKNVLGYFENRISDAKKETLNLYFAKRTDLFKEDMHISCDYNPQSETDHTVICRIIQDNNVKIEIKINTGNEDTARKICSKWNAQAHKIYTKIMDILTN